MNIFWLDHNISKSAQYHNELHLTKMPLETAQILSNVFAFNGLKSPYRPTHQNHPCCIWTRTSLDNFSLLCVHGLALCEEFKFRRNKTHSCQRVIEWCQVNSSALDLPQGPTEPPKCMPPEFHRSNLIESYLKIGNLYKIKNKNKYIIVKVINIYEDKQVCIEYLNKIIPNNRKRTMCFFTKIKELTIADKMKLL